METQNTTPQLNSEGLAFLKETAKWGYFLSILGFIGIGFMVIIALFAGAIFSTLPGGDYGYSGIMSGAFFTIFYLLFALLYFFPVLYLYKFSSKMKQAINQNNTQELNASLGYLKSHYKFIGILTIVMLSIYALIFIVGLVGGLAAASF